MEKILFVNPPLLFRKGLKGKATTATIRQNVCIPALIILGELKRRKFKTFFIDMATDGSVRTRTFREELQYSGMSLKELVQRIGKINPKIILLESMFLSNFPMFEETARVIKESFPKTVLVAGGGFASQKPEWHIKKADFVMTSTGGNGIAELAMELRKDKPDFGKIRGLIFKSGKKIIFGKSWEEPKAFSPSFDYKTVLLREDKSYRYPEISARSNELYGFKIGENEKGFALYGSKGCPVGCSYCSAQSRDGAVIRHVGGKRLFQQAKMLHEKFGVNVFYNQADTFGLHREDIVFLKLIAKYRKKEHEIRLSNPNAFFLRLFFKKGKIDKEFVMLLKKAGFNVITIAIETFNQKYNKKVDFKLTPLESILDLGKFINSKKIKTTVYMMYGFPGQTIEEMENDIRKAMELKKAFDKVCWGNCVIFPGSEYYNRIIGEKRIDEEEFEENARKGYFFEEPAERLNFTRIPSKKLKKMAAQIRKEF